jgi:hypothetical protein
MKLQGFEVLPFQGAKQMLNKSHFVELRLPLCLLPTFRTTDVSHFQKGEPDQMLSKLKLFEPEIAYCSFFLLPTFPS